MTRMSKKLARIKAFSAQYNPLFKEEEVKETMQINKSYTEGANNPIVRPTTDVHSVLRRCGFRAKIRAQKIKFSLEKTLDQILSLHFSNWTRFQ